MNDKERAAVIRLKAEIDHQYAMARKAQTMLVVAKDRYDVTLRRITELEAELWQMENK